MSEIFQFHSTSESAGLQVVHKSASQEQSLGQRNSRKQQWEQTMAKELQAGVEVISSDPVQHECLSSHQKVCNSVVENTLQADTSVVQSTQSEKLDSSRVREIKISPLLSLQNNLIKDQMLIQSGATGSQSSVQPVNSKTASERVMPLRSLAASQLELNPQNVLITRHGNHARIWIRNSELEPGLVREICKSLKEDFEQEGYLLTSVALNGVILWEASQAEIKQDTTNLLDEDGSVAVLNRLI